MSDDAADALALLFANNPELPTAKWCELVGVALLRATQHDMLPSHGIDWAAPGDLKYPWVAIDLDKKWRRPRPSRGYARHVRRRKQMERRI